MLLFVCTPSYLQRTNVVKKGKRKKNKTKTKVRYVEDQVKFRRKGNKNKRGRDQEVSFSCKNGYWYV